MSSPEIILTLISILAGGGGLAGIYSLIVFQKSNKRKLKAEVRKAEADADIAENEAELSSITLLRQEIENLKKELNEKSLEIEAIKEELEAIKGEKQNIEKLHSIFIVAADNLGFLDKIRKEVKRIKGT